MKTNILRCVRTRNYSFFCLPRLLILYILIESLSVSLMKVLLMMAVSQNIISCLSVSYYLDVYCIEMLMLLS